MALVINTTPGTAGFNCYATVAECTDFATSKLNTAWAALPLATKEASLIWSSRQLDVLEFQGWPTDPAQPMNFPRTGIWRDGGSYSYGDDAIYSTLQLDGTTIPPFLRDACCDLAIQLTVSDVTAPTGTEGFKEISVESISLVMDSKDRLSWFSDSTRNLVWRYLKNRSKYNAPVSRVG